MSGIKGNTQPGDAEVSRAVARLPGLDIEIVHRWLPNGDAERVSIHLTASPSFEALGSVILEATNPFTFWTEAMRLAWVPWLEAARAVMQPLDAAPSLPRTGPSRSETR